MGETSAGRPYVIISSDCHAGADLLDYRPYLERRWHDEFDAWAGSYADAWGQIDTESEYKAGVSSFMSPLNWESAKRLALLEGEGIVAEVIFPNTTPPFFPNGMLAAPGPRNRDEYERRWAGIQAHNRWLADFCADAPGRRFGVAQLFIDVVDDAVAEIHRAREAGLASVMLPSDHHLKLHNLYYRSLDPIWAACEQLDMPIGRHGAVVASDEEPESLAAAHACGAYETLYFGHRSLFQLVLSGVFERHPNLKFVFTELGAGWVRSAMAQLDAYFLASKVDGSIPAMFGGEAADELSMLPSEYVQRSCWYGSVATPTEAPLSPLLDRFMWGADFPHHEGTVPYTLEVLRATVGDLSDADLRRLFSENAAAVYGADLEALQVHADRVGFTSDQLARPLAESEVPDDPSFRMFYLAPNIAFRATA